MRLRSAGLLLLALSTPACHQAELDQLDKVQQAREDELIGAQALANNLSEYRRQHQLLLARLTQVEPGVVVADLPSAPPPRIERPPPEEPRARSFPLEFLDPTAGKAAARRQAIGKLDADLRALAPARAEVEKIEEANQAIKQELRRLGGTTGPAMR